MDKAQILNLLSPFIKGEVPKDERWLEARMKIGDSVPEQEIEDAIKILRKMFHDPFDPNPPSEPAVPGAHGVYSRLLWRRGNIRKNIEENKLLALWRAQNRARGNFFVNAIMILGIINPQK